MWSVGIFLYALLCGMFPFRAKNYPDLYRRISRGTYVFSCANVNKLLLQKIILDIHDIQETFIYDYWPNLKRFYNFTMSKCSLINYSSTVFDLIILAGTYEVPDEIGLTARHLISQLLCVDPKQRISARTAINHPWLAKYNSASIDINRLRFDSSILISNRPEDDIDEQTLKELELFGLDRTELVRLIMTKTHSSTSTLYYLLLNHVINKRALLGGPRRASSTPILNPIIHCNVTHLPKEVMTNTVSRTSILRYGISALQSTVLSTVSFPTAHPCVAAQPTE